MSNSNKVKTEPAATYKATIKANSASVQKEDKIIAEAMAILRARMRVYEYTFTSPELVKKYIRLQLSENSYESFGILYLNNQHQLITDEVLFRGTIDQAAVYPREILKRSLELGAAALIIYHNHPSGACDPSMADKTITAKIKQVVELVDMRVLDHIIVGNGGLYSFADSGLI